MSRGPASQNGVVKVKPILAVALALIVFAAVGMGRPAYAAPTITGTVVDSEEAPIVGAKVTLWSERELVASYMTEEDGLFEFETEADVLYDVLAFADDPSTPGVDYLPVWVRAASSGGEGFFVTLRPAASLVLEGDIQYVESEDLPVSILYAVLDPVSDSFLELDGFRLVYGSAAESQSYFLDLEGNHVLVPAGEPFKVGVECSILVVSDIESRSFEVDEPLRFNLRQGEQAIFNIRPYSIRSNLGISESLLEAVKKRLEEMDGYGFYTATEWGVTAKSERWLTEAGFLLGEGRFVESFDACKRGYIGLRETRDRLMAMLGDASFSVYTIIVFLALSSTTIAFLLSNRDSTKILGGIVVYALALAILYITYPGSVIVPSERFVGTSVLAIAFSLTAALIFPRFMKARGGDTYLPVRNIVVPIFSLAKRSIRRRRLRFLLTLTSITVLVMSFVSLTSFSEGYGLIVSRVSNRAASVDSVLLRAKDYTEMEPTFLSQKDVASGWLGRQPESVVVSPKAENVPSLRPIARLNGVPIRGILGVDTRIETAIPGIAGAVREGELPSEDGVVISEGLQEALGVEIGDFLTLNVLNLRLEGVLDDEAVLSLRELGGTSYVPGKLVNIDPDGEVPQLVVEQCEPTEFVVLHLTNALTMPLVGITRVAITVGQGVDAHAFAERLALERGYWAWSASAEGLFFARLGSYLEGKGLPLLVPWGIVVLNVVITMLNSMYERRKEIHILSSVGLNPAQIAAIFVAEATIIGLTAGGVGYLAGLGIYRGMAVLGITLEVRQKVSAFWSLASIGIAMTAVLMGAFAALRSSVIITPSLQRRWKIEKKEMSLFEPFEIIIPVRLLPEEINDFVAFVVRELRNLEGGLDRKTSSIKVYEETEDAERRIDFVYKAVGTVTSNFYTKNTLFVERADEGEIAVRLTSYGERDWAHVTGSLVRMLVMRWSLT